MTGTGEARTPLAASLGWRLLGYALDSAVALWLAVWCVFLRRILGWPWLTAFNHYELLWFLLMFGQRAISGWLYGASAGKAVLGLVVVNDRDGSKPKLGPMLLRELVGTPLSSIFFGVGYWRRPAWSDQMAHTAVRHQRRVTGARWVTATALLVSFAGLIVYGQISQEWQQSEAEFTAEFTPQANAVNALSSQIRVLRQAQPATMSDYRGKSVKLKALCAQYQNHLREAVGLIDGAQADGALRGSERRQFEVIEAAYRLRSEQAAAITHEADLVLGYNPAQESPTDLQSQIDLLESDITAIDVSVAAKLKAGGLDSAQ